jgi:hypothetical protein
MLPVALAVAITAPVLGEVSETTKPSSGSTLASPDTSTEIVWLVSPTPKLTTPLGSTPPTKSAAMAGLLPVPVTEKLAEWDTEVSPLRVTV